MRWHPQIFIKTGLIFFSKTCPPQDLWTLEVLREWPLGWHEDDIPYKPKYEVHLEYLREACGCQHIYTFWSQKAQKNLKSKNGEV